jgi:hypothetical protein
MASLVNAVTRAAMEGFSNPGGTDAYKTPSPYLDAAAIIVAFILSLILVSLIGLFLWNNSIVPLFEFARPAKSVFQILGLMIFLAMIVP